MPPSAEPTPTAIIDDAKERARQIIQEAEKRAHKILAEAGRSRAPAPATPSAGNSGQPVQETIQLMPLNLNPEDDSHDEASVNQTTQFIRPKDETNEA